MTTKPQILDAALDALRDGRSLTIDAVAQEAELTKPGVVHHFPTKEALSFAVLEHLLARWERELSKRAGDDAGPEQRLRAYAELTLLGEMDTADLALFADPRLHEKLSVRWGEQMDAWFGSLDHPRAAAVRYLADGAWIDRCLGVLPQDHDHRAAVLDVALSLLEKEMNS